MTTTRSIAMACGLAGLLGLGAVAVSRGQQAEPTGEAKVSPRKALRDQVVKLRAEVDLRQLEFDVVRSCLFDEMKNSQRGSTDKRPQSLQEGVSLAAIMGNKEAEEALRNGEAAVEKLSDQWSDEQRSQLDRKKRDFARLAAEFNEKKLDLEEAEIRYREVR
jgi:hypothetical protein